MQRSSMWWGRFALASVALMAASTPTAQGGRPKKGSGDDGVPENASIACSHYDRRAGWGIGLYDPVTDESGVLVPSGADPAWSPDGTRIAYEAQGPSIWTCKSDGTGDEQFVIAAEQVIWSLDWSSDGPFGEWLLYSDDDQTGTQSIVYAVRPDGTGKVELVREDVVLDLRWAPDATRFVGSVDTTWSGGTFWGLVVYSVGLVNGQLAVTGAVPVEFGSISGWPESDWSNDGRWIVASLHVGGQWDLWLLDPDDPSITVRLTDSPDYERWPTFDATDDVVYFNIEGDRSRLHAVDIGTGVTSLITRQKIRAPRAKRLGS